MILYDGTIHSMVMGPPTPNISTFAQVLLKPRPEPSSTTTVERSLAAAIVSGGFRYGTAMNQCFIMEQKRTCRIQMNPAKHLKPPQYLKVRLI